MKKDNPVPKIVFFPPEWSKKISLVLLFFGFVFVLILTIDVKENYISEYLKNVSEMNITLILTISALVIAIFQFDKNFFRNTTSDNNSEKLVKSYVFNAMVMVLLSIVSYFLSWLSKTSIEISGFIIYFRVWIFIEGLCLLYVIFSCLATFVAFFNIK